MEKKKKKKEKVSLQCFQADQKIPSAWENNAFFGEIFFVCII